MSSVWRNGLAAFVLGFGLIAGGGSAIDGTTGSLVGAAHAQGAFPSYQTPLALHRSCSRKIRAAYRPAGCTRRCYPRNFYRQRMDYCIGSGGQI